MNTEHTKGQWTAEGQAIYSGSTYIAQCWDATSRELTEYVDAVGSGEVPESAKEAQANARLIASAPELLAALESIRDTANRSDIGVLDRALLMFETAKAAIAKATGH